nr:DUF92 domain-containing protein [Alkalihalobacillus sp. CinArs1]
MLLYFIVILLTGVVGLKMGALSRKGTVAAIFTGNAIAYGFGWKGLVLLGVFFGTSTLWSKYKQDRKQETERIVVKGSARDEYQVLANGGAAAFAGVMMAMFPSLWWIAFFISALAASNADTWASELGVLAKRDPYHILKLRTVPRGTSGAVSMPGLLASFLASLLVAGVGFFLFDLPFTLFLVITGAGVLGSMIDTIIGATIQEEFYCETCSLKTERTVHCGVGTTKIKGISGINNDVVNMVSSLCGGIACGVWFL